jgi:hypothetical protein
MLMLDNADDKMDTTDVATKANSCIRFVSVSPVSGNVSVCNVSGLTTGTYGNNGLSVAKCSKTGHKNSHKSLIMQ